MQLENYKMRKAEWKLYCCRKGQKGFVDSLLFFEQISREMGWQTGNQIRAYPRNSVVFVLKDEAQILSGIHGVRGNTDEGMPILTVWPELAPANIAEYGDLALIAITATCRGNLLVAWLLIAEAWRYAKAERFLKIWAEIPVANFAAYNRIGWPYRRIGPARLHWGEPCYPCMMDLDELEATVASRAKKSALHAKVFASMYR